MMDFIVDQGKCISCGTCVRDCVTEAIEMRGGVPTVAPRGEKKCIKCQHCLAVCPTGAVSIFGIRPEDCAAVKTPPRPEEVESLLKFRRSCRHYKHEAVSRDKLDKLEEVVHWAPTGINMRELHFTVVERVEAMDRFRGLVNQRILEAIMNKTLPPGMEELRLSRPILERGDDLVFRGAPHLIAASARNGCQNGVVDSVIALSQFEVMAQSLGLGTLWCGFALMAFSTLCPEAGKMLGIPEGFTLAYVMLFGEPAVVYPHATRPRPSGLNVIGASRS